MSHRQEDLSRRGWRCQPPSALLPIVLPHTLSATSPRKSLRLTFCSNSVWGIKFGREVVSNILCSDSTLPHVWNRAPILAPHFCDYHHVQLRRIVPKLGNEHDIQCQILLFYFSIIFLLFTGFFV